MTLEESIHPVLEPNSAKSYPLPGEKVEFLTAQLPLNSISASSLSAS